MNHKKLWFGVGIVVVLATTALYALLCINVWNQPFYITSYLFVILSEIVAVITASKASSNPLRSVCSVIAGVYCIGTIIVTVVFACFFPYLLSWFIAINIVLLAAAIIGLLFSGMTIKSTEDQVKRERQIRSSFEKCESAVNDLLFSSIGRSHREEIEKLLELVRFSDYTEITGMEQEILQKLQDLKQISEDEFQQAVEEVSSLILRRREMAKAKKML